MERVLGFSSNEAESTGLLSPKGWFSEGTRTGYPLSPFPSWRSPDVVPSERISDDSLRGRQLLVISFSWSFTSCYITIIPTGRLFTTLWSIRNELHFLTNFVSLRSNFQPGVALEEISHTSGNYADLRKESRHGQAGQSAAAASAPPSAEYAPLSSATRAWEVPRRSLNIIKIIGKGAFGQVAKATAIDLPGKPGLSVVAVKMLKGNAKFRTAVFGSTVIPGFVLHLLVSLPPIFLFSEFP